MGPFEELDSAVGRGRSQHAAQTTKVCVREVSCMISLFTKLRRHRDSISCLAPRARLASDLVRSPVQLLARPAAVLDALARTALGAAVIGAARARAAAALASPGRACARTRGSGARRRAALSQAGRKLDGLRRDRHRRSVSKELFHGALELVALGALGDQRRDGGGERSSPSVKSRTGELLTTR
jgi:hypothetical protein